MTPSYSAAGRSASPQDAKESSGSSTMSTAASYANGHDRPPEVNISVCGDSGESVRERERKSIS